MISSYISHEQFECSNSLHFKEKLLFDIMFPFLYQMRFISSSLGYSPAQQAGVARRAQSIISAAGSSSQRCLLAASRRPLALGSPSFPPHRANPSPVPILSPLIWTVAVRDEDNPFTLWASQENTVLWLIPGGWPRKGKETQTAI